MNKKLNKKGQRWFNVEQKEKFADELRKNLPPIISRKEIPRVLGGLYSSGYMANLDCKGDGPERIIISGQTAYTRESIISWLILRMQGA